ncbi:alpha/beta hydrolase [Mycolicibacterium farcinogenes]|uniref:Alpha/beta hydrolase family protein n=1 Tax=Mycolicibacterium farcinogenes TaxID=1802 RepID=A0ACD1FHD0_MYCFR|nr:alpha/beta hydrolase [Mycolicibacterium farcinogenes]QZH66434.1 alpha/beta hydrolase family protein [Mycolicibacterium farcinogenes]
MGLTLADIERWDASTLREVATALGKRGASTNDVRSGLTKLPLIESWQGSGGDAARASLDKLSAYLASHGEEMARVSSATRSSADEIEGVKSALHRIYEDARNEGFSIDPVSGEVTATDQSKVGDPVYALQQADLEVRIKDLLVAADEADDGLAKAITDAGGHSAGTDPPDVRDALTKPVPDDPNQFHDFWEGLTPEERDALYQRDPTIANHNGMPGVDQDYYNRQTLDRELPRAQAAQDRVDALKAQHPDWADGKNIPPPNEPGAIFADRPKYEAWQKELSDAQNGARYLPDLQAIDRAVRDNPERKLMLLDTKSGEQVHAAIAVGDPDTADHVSVTAPGLNTTVHGSIEGMANEAMNVRKEALDQLDLAKRGDETVAAIAWIGYDIPQVPGWDQFGTSADGVWDVMHDDMARAGAHDLAGFYDGINAAHQGPLDLTAIGHSYGSLTTGLALQEPGNHGVDNVLFYGSPGIEASTPQDLQMQPGHVYAMEAPDDPIQGVYDARSVIQGIPIIGSYLNDEFGDFGPNPATNPNFTQLATAPTTVPDGRTLEGVSGPHAHSQYPQLGDNNQPRISGYNIAAVVAGTAPIPDK